MKKVSNAINKMYSVFIFTSSFDPKTLILQLLNIVNATNTQSEVEEFLFGDFALPCDYTGIVVEEFLRVVEYEPYMKPILECMCKLMDIHGTISVINGYIAQEMPINGFYQGVDDFIFKHKLSQYVDTILQIDSTFGVLTDTINGVNKYLFTEDSTKVIDFLCQVLFPYRKFLVQTLEGTPINFTQVVDITNF